jgi:Domain of unknown function (DUF1990)
MGTLTEGASDLLRGLNPASRGVGPLLQRDYWAVIEHCRLKPSEVMERVARHFPRFAPEELAAFRREGGREGPLEVGEELRVRIRMAGTFGVRVLHRDANSLTLGTLEGHPEAGRITFGAYRNERGDVLFHIRSLARSGSQGHYMGFLTAGEAMQTNTWTDFINNVACTMGEGVVGFIHAETVRHKDWHDEDDVEQCAPTFIARGD